MNYQELTSNEKFNILKELLNNVEDLYPSNWMTQDVSTEGKYFKEYDFDKYDSHLILNAKCVDSYGGEGQGDNYYSVYYFPTLNIYVKFYGWYQSNYGTEYQSMKLVTPIEKKITIYE